MNDKPLDCIGLPADAQIGKCDFKLQVPSSQRERTEAVQTTTRKAMTTRDEFAKIDQRRQKDASQGDVNRLLAAVEILSEAVSRAEADYRGLVVTAKRYSLHATAADATESADYLKARLAQAEVTLRKRD